MQRATRFLPWCAAAALALVAAGCSSSSSPAADLRQQQSALGGVPITFKFDNFSDVSLLQLNGSAVQAGSSLRLTDTLGTQAGSFFCKQKISLKNDRSFSTYFRMRMPFPGGGGGFNAGADGITFVIQPLSNTAGSAGGGIGYQGIASSLGVEFDSYYNPELGDPDNHHVGTHVNGVMSSHLQTASVWANWSNGSTWHVWIDYDGLGNKMEIRVAENSSVRPASPILTQNNFDLSSTFGVDEVYAGFTAATGGAWEQHLIDLWYFQNDELPIDTNDNTYTQAPTSVVVSASPSSTTRTSTITATVRNNDNSVSPGTAVTLSTTNGTLSGASATTDANGQVQATLTYAGTTDTTARVGVTAAGGAYGYADVGLVGNRTITASATAGGSISPSGAVSLVYGSSQAFSIAPATGYHLVSVAVDGVSQGAITSYTFNNLVLNHTIAATFAIDTFTITSSAGAHGSISPAGAQTVSYGSTPGYSIFPNAAYKVADVQVDGESVGAVTSYTFPAVSANHTLSATFALLDTPPTLVVDPGTASWREEQPPVEIDKLLSLTDPDGPNLTGARVSISSGYVANQDRLTFTPQGAIAGSFNTTTGILTLTGSADAATYQAVLRSVAYSNVAPGGTPDTRARQVTYSLGATSLFNPDTAHYYEFVSAGGITWTAARAAAATRTYYGMQGYLATITSAAENAFVASKLAGQGWMGASDENVEWTWRWVTGPEGLENGGLGRHFFTEVGNWNNFCASGARGNAVNGQYNNWAGCEPNDAGGEDYAHFLSDGRWNDYPNNAGASIQGYVVEYGGMPLDEVVQLSGTRDLQVTALQQFTITTSATGNGTVTPSGSMVVKEGHWLTVTISPAEHHHIVDVLLNGESLGPVPSYTFQNISSNGSLSASFAIDQYAVTASAEGHGTIACDSPVNWGAATTCVLTPEEGYQVSRLLDNGANALPALQGTEYTLFAVTADHDLQASFLKKRGTTCDAQNECTSGFCVDGVCCESACDGQCESCGGRNAGLCKPVSGPPLFGRQACANDGTNCGGTCDGANRQACAYPSEATECRPASCLNGTVQLAASCDGAGACPQPQVGSCGRYACQDAQVCNGDCRSDGDCAENAWCQAGVCLPKGGNGDVCGSGNQCGSGFCVDGVCCNAACDGQCEACDRGTCEPVAGAPHGERPQCADTGEGCGGACDGAHAAACAYPGAESQCRAPSCADDVATLSATCDGRGGCPTVETQACRGFTCGAQACLGDCQGDGDCQSGFWCSAGVCEPKKTVSIACSADDQCDSGFCVDGVCCNSACGGQCEACDVSGSVGQCTPGTGAPRGGRPACGSDGTVCGGSCDGINASACAYPGGATECRAPTCHAGQAIAAGFCDGQGGCPQPQYQYCGDFTCGDSACRGDCQADADCATGSYCSAGVCVPVKQPGEACGAADQCGSGFCVDGVCCNAACGGQCQACDVPGHAGQCTAVTGAPAGTRPACSTDGTECGGSCDGAHEYACQYPAAATQCRAASCSGAIATAAGACDGAGHCPAPIANACERYGCGDTACKTSCESDADCGAGLHCAEGACRTDAELENARQDKLHAYTAAGTGLGCSAGGGGASAAYLAVIAAAALLLRRRRASRWSRAAAVAAAVAVGLVPSAARAQAQVTESIDVQRFEPGMGPRDILGLQSPQVAGHLEWMAVAFADYGNEPLRLVDPTGAQPALGLLDGQTALHVGGSIGLFGRAEVSVMLPIVVAQSGGTGGLEPALDEVPRAGLGGVFVTPKVALPSWGPVSLGVAAPVLLPFGDPGGYLGTGRVSAMPRLMAEWGQSFRVAANAGMAFRAGRQLLNLHVGTAFTWGVGAEKSFQFGAQRFEAQGTLIGEVGLESFQAASNPLELMLGLRWRGPNGLHVTLGGGPGLTTGYGTPAYRLLAAVGFDAAR